MNSEPVSVGIALFEGFEELDTIGPLEVFGMASTMTDGLTVETLAPAHAPDLVTGTHGLRVRPDTQQTAWHGDILVVPGGGWRDGRVGIRTEIDHGELTGFLEAHAEDGGTVTSVCTGAMSLAAVGLLDGLPATTHADSMDDLEAAGAIPTDARVVDTGQVVTAGGVTAGIDLGLWLVERYLDAEVATRVAKRMEYEPRGEVVVTES